MSIIYSKVLKGGTKLSENIIYGLSDKLKLLRKRHNLSQKEVANRLGISRQSVNRFENDGMTPSIDNLIQFAIMYNVTVDYLLGVGKESYLYLHEFNESQRNFILEIVNGLKKNFNNNEVGD